MEKDLAVQARTVHKVLEKERLRCIRIITCLAILNIASVLFSIYLWTSLPAKEFGSLSSGYTTDFGPARPHIQPEQVRFTGSPSFTPSGKMYTPNPSKIKYVGDPSPEIDQAWDELTWGRYILVTEDEMKAQWPNNWKEFWDEPRGGYFVGFDMLHTLHCVNELRRNYYPEYYRIRNTSIDFVHRDHCIEHIRQYVICAGDMTPIPTRYYHSIGRNYIDSDYPPHTCRNWERLRQWVSDRSNGSIAVQPKLRQTPQEDK